MNYNWEALPKRGTFFKMEVYKIINKYFIIHMSIKFTVHIHCISLSLISGFRHLGYSAHLSLKKSAKKETGGNHHQNVLAVVTAQYSGGSTLSSFAPVTMTTTTTTKL